jgi:DNA transformation protein
MAMGDTLYFRVDDTTRPAYERHGMGPFSYSTRKGVVLVRTYAAVPVEWLEDREQFLAAASRALSVAGG